MILIINGEEKEYKENITIKEIIVDLQIENKVMASAVNMNVVKKENWENYSPNDGDKIEFLQFVGGG
jgi:sulfur carrier protein